MKFFEHKDFGSEIGWNYDEWLEGEEDEEVPIIDLGEMQDYLMEKMREDERLRDDSNSY